MFLHRYIDACYTCHSKISQKDHRGKPAIVISFPITYKAKGPKRMLSLPLLVAWISTNHTHHTLTANNLTFIAYFLY